MTRAFTDETAAVLALGKYTRWATDLTADELQATLWAVGEFACRALPTDGEGKAGAWRIAHQRQVAALRILVWMVRHPGGVSLVDALAEIRAAAAVRREDLRDGERKADEMIATLTGGHADVVDRDGRMKTIGRHNEHDAVDGWENKP